MRQVLQEVEELGEIGTEWWLFSADIFVPDAGGETKK